MKVVRLHLLDHYEGGKKVKGGPIAFCFNDSVPVVIQQKKFYGISTVVISIGNCSEVEIFESFARVLAKFEAV